MKKVLKITLLIILVVFIILQIIPNKLPENSDNYSKDLIEVENPPEEVEVILLKACYDCHSNHTEYPWYSYVAPVSWLVAKDVLEGREELNLSEWSEQSKRRKIKILSEMAEEIEEGKMPLQVYTITHRNAILSDNEIEIITSWTKSLSNEILGD